MSFCSAAHRNGRKAGSHWNFCGSLPRVRCRAGRNTRRFCWPQTKCFMSTDQMTSRTAGRLTRRQMLQRTCAGFGWVGLAGVLGPQMLMAASGSRAPQFAPRAKRVIFLFMNGGPSHVDTFDPKPALQKHEGEKPEGDFYRKQKNGGFMPSPFSFHKCGQSGIEVSETLPNIAKIIDDCCIIRSMRTDVPNH